MTICQNKYQDISISVELLPEFGFTVQDEPVYGPGSVFQGIVHLELKEIPVAADKLVLAFKGAENATAIHDGTKFLIPLLKNAFFSMQQTLWQRTRNDCLLQEHHYQFPFTIQMPMIQFPPSMEHSLYQCKFYLTAKLIRTTFTLPTVVSHHPIRYMPFIETSPLKTPVVEQGHNSGLFAAVRLHSLSYVAGDTIPITLVTSKLRKSKSTSSKSEDPAEVSSISVELVERVELLQNRSVSATKVVASAQYRPTTKGSKYSLVKGGAEYQLFLPLPVDLTPSINYSKIVDVSHTLQIRIKGNHTVLLGSLWSSTIDMELPLKIGTLGYGIRASPDLQICYVDSSESPRFLRSLVYEESLPLYESSKLPAYPESSLVV